MAHSTLRAVLLVFAMPLACSSSSGGSTPDGGGSPPDAKPTTHDGHASASHDASHSHDAGHDTGHSVPDSSSLDDAAPSDGRPDHRATDASLPTDAPLEADAKSDRDAGHEDATTDATHAGDARHDAPSEAAPPDAPSDARGAPEGAADASSDGGVDAGFDASTPALAFVGRVEPTDGGATYQWSGSQVVARFQGPEFDLRMNDPGNMFDVIVDGVIGPTPLQAESGQTSYTVASGLDGGTHVVSLYRRTEAEVGPTEVLGSSFPGGALLAPAPRPALRIEVIGDSVSCGYGDLGMGPNCDGSGANEDDDLYYGAVAARTLGAELHTNAWSGLGLYENYDGSTMGTMPDLFPYTLPSDYPATAPSPALWDFSEWTPDAVVIELGNNDFQGGNNDPGEAYTTTYESFLSTLRGLYPNAYILCAVGPLVPEPDHTTWLGYVQTAVSLEASAGNTNIGVLDFGVQNVDTYCDGMDGTVACGCDYHPTVATHAVMASQLVSALDDALGL